MYVSTGLCLGYDLALTFFIFLVNFFLDLCVRQMKHKQLHILRGPNIESNKFQGPHIGRF